MKTNAGFFADVADAGGSVLFKGLPIVGLQ